MTVGCVELGAIAHHGLYPVACYYRFYHMALLVCLNESTHTAPCLVHNLYLDEKAAATAL